MTTLDDFQQQRRIRELHFAEDWGMVFELLSLPRMAGRVWAALAIAEEPHLSADELEDRLEASAGSISTATRFLLRQGVLDRVRVAGERRLFYALKPGAVQILLARRLAVMSEIKELAERGMREFGDRPLVEERCREVYEFYALMERELPALIERFERERRAGSEGGSR